MRHLIVLVLAALFVAGCSTTSSNAYVETEQLKPESFEADADYYANNAQRYYDKGNYRAALDQFKKQDELDSTWGSKAGIGYCQYHLGRQHASQGRIKTAETLFGKAEDTFKQAWDGTLEKSTRDPNAHQWKLALGLAMTERAIGQLDSVKRRQLDARVMDPDKEKSAEAHKELQKVIKHRIQYYENSAARLTKLTKMEFASPDAYLSLGEVSLILENEPGAEKAFLEYPNLARDSVEFWEKQRYASSETFISKRDQKEADAIFAQKVDSATSKTVDVLMRLAEIKYNRKDFAESIEFLNEALELRPERTELNVPLAECYQGQRDYRKALEHIDIYIKSSAGFDENTQKAYRLRSKFLKELGIEDK